LGSVSDALCHYLWGNPFCDWSFSPAIGNNGGILTIWCSSKGRGVFSFYGPGFVGVCLDWGISKNRYFVVNIYSKCMLSDKRVMWDKLVDLKDSLGGEV
jgi:hypothetical protein